MRRSRRPSSGRAADRGTSVHDYLEAAAEGRSLPELTGDAARYQPAADRWLDSYQPRFVDAEFTVFGEGYAGTADFLAVVDGRLVIGDYKTSKRLYPEVALQLAAIRHAEVIVKPDGASRPVPPVEGCVAVLLTPACLEAWRWRHGPDPLGERLEVPA